jgi:hypothetical protein
MARSLFTVAIAMASALSIVLVLLQLVSVFGAPYVDFGEFIGFQKDGKVPYRTHFEPRASGSQYLLGVGKADITG